MATFEWDITEDFTFKLGGSGGFASGHYSVNAEEFDIAVGNLPFNLDLDVDHPYERVTAQLRKDQFDAQPTVGEQSLSGWWLRSQFAFWGGAGIQFLEPLQVEDVGQRFRESSGVEVFTQDGTVHLLKDTELGPDAAGECEAVAGPNRLLQRDGTAVSVWDGTTETPVTGTTSAVSLAYTGDTFLVGDNGNILSLPEASGTALTTLYNSGGGNVNVFWAKDRIFAGVGPKLYELTIPATPPQAFPGTTLYTHPDSGWEWISVTETAGAVWAAGRSGDRSAVHVITISDTGSTPTLVGGTVAIQLPDGETVNTMRNYLNLLLLGTSEGLRVALTDADVASLGPLLWDDGEAVYSVVGRRDYAHAGLANGLTRKVDLGNEVAGDLAFAWSNHLAGGAGTVRTVLWFQGSEHFTVDSAGTYREHATDLVAQGSLSTGHIRFGTAEAKYFHDARLGIHAVDGATIGVSHEHDGHDPTSIATLGNLDGDADLRLEHPQIATSFALSFTLNRSSTDNTNGPELKSYQLRALPAPTRRQRLLRLPILMLDWEKNRYGVDVGGPGFAHARLQQLEDMENKAAPVLVNDLRTGETIQGQIEQVAHEGRKSPSGDNANFGGRTFITIRTFGG